MRLPSVLTQIRSKVRVLFISRAIIRLEVNSKCFLTFLNGLINVYTSGSIMIIVITLHEPHNYDCRTLPFSLHFTSLIRVKLQLSKPLSSLPTQFSKTMAISGLRSVASLRNYIGHPTSKQLRSCFDILSDALSGRLQQPQ